MNYRINQRSGGGKNTQNILLDGFYLLFQETLRQKKKTVFLTWLKLCPQIGQGFEEKVRGGNFVTLNLIINLIFKQL